jgi:hypothetical protein
MKTFKQYVREKYVPPNDGPLYHFIGNHSLNNVLHHNTLSPITYNHPDWTPANPAPAMTETGHISLTRDSGLNFSGRPYRIKIDRQSIKKSGHIPKEYYDPFMHVPGDWDRDTAAWDPKVPHELKHIESEEQVEGQIPNLHKHILEIGITKKEHENLRSSIESSKKGLETLTKKKEMAKKGFFWHNGEKSFKPISNDRQQNIANRDLEDDGKYYHETIQNATKILNHSKLKIYDRFE